MSPLKKNDFSDDNRGRELSNRFGVMKGLAMISQLGFVMVLPFIAGVFIGGKLDEWLGTKPLFLIVCILLFGASSFINFYRMAMKSVDIEKTSSEGSIDIGDKCGNKKDDNRCS